MAVYDVKCITMESNPRFGDCRDIKTIGFHGRDNTITELSPAEVYDLIGEDDEKVIVEHEGEEKEVVQATHKGTKYVRTEQKDTKDDDLLKKPTC